MDDAEKLDRQAFKVQLSQGRMILKLTSCIDGMVDSRTAGGIDPATSQVILDLAKAAAFLGGRGA